jgi:hypothetical protein
MWFVLGMSVLLGAASDADAARTDKERELKILARGVWPVLADKPSQLVIRSGEELALALGVAAKEAREERLQKEATADVTHLLKVRAIDWERQMLVVVAAGAKPTGGYRVEITSLRVKEKTLTVAWKLHRPAADAVVTRNVTHPSQMVLVERFAGTIQFDPSLPKK